MRTMSCVVRFTTIFIFHVQIYGKYFNKYYPPPLLLTIFIQILGKIAIFVHAFRVFRCVSHGLRSHDHRPLPVLSPQGRSVHGPISLPADISVIQCAKAQRISPALTKGTEWAAHWYWMSPSSALNERPISIEWETMSRNQLKKKNNCLAKRQYENR